MNQQIIYKSKNICCTSEVYLGPWGEWRGTKSLVNCQHFMVVLARSQIHISLAYVAVLKQADSNMFFCELNITIEWAREALPSKNL